MDRYTRVLGVGVVLCASQSAVAAAPARAPDYPAKPIRMVVAATAGSGPEILARQIGAKLTEAWGQQVVVDSRPGATGLVGAEIVARSAPDGYTLWMATLTQLIGTTMYQRYQMASEFTPVGMVASTAFIIAVNAALPVQTIPEFIAYAKARPGQILYGSSGQGSTAHLCMEMFRSLTGINIVHVPYKGAVPAITDMMAGQIQVSCHAAPSLPMYVKTGRLRYLGITTLTRTKIAPDVPPIADTIPGFEILGWYGLLAPPGTPREIVAKINAAVAKLLQAPEVQEKLVTVGAEAAASSPAEFGAFLRKETAKWGKLLRDADIRPTQ